MKKSHAQQQLVKIMNVPGTIVMAIASVLALVGCTPGPKTQPRPVDAPPSVSWDGTYRGGVQITGLGSGVQRRWCETDPQMVVQVANNSFSYAMPHPNAPNNPTPVYTATIAPDGTFRSDVGTGVMRGQVIGTHMAGIIDGSVCGYAFSTDRS